MAIEPTNAPATPANSAAPVSPTSGNGEKTYTEAELNQRVEAARTEEKSKLYSEIDSLRTQLKDSTLTVQERDALKTQLNEAQAQLTAIKAAQKEGAIDPLLLAKQVAEDTRKAVTGEFGAKLDQMQESLRKSQEAQRRQELANYRQTLITAANGRIIPAMVIGNTEAELDAAAANSKAQYEQIAASANVVPAASGAGAPPPVSPQASGSGNNDRGVDGFTRNADPSTYGKNRAQTLAALKTRFG